MTDELLPELPEPTRLGAGRYPDGVSTYTADQLRAYAREAIRLAQGPGEVARSSDGAVVVYSGFIYENGVHTPTVLIAFKPNDWAARDALVARVRTLSPSLSAGEVA